jgi:hypothetical protein
MKLHAWDKMNFEFMSQWRPYHRCDRIRVERREVRLHYGQYVRKQVHVLICSFIASFTSMNYNGM